MKTILITEIHPSNQLDECRAKLADAVQRLNDANDTWYFTRNNLQVAIHKAETALHELGACIANLKSRIKQGTERGEDTATHAALLLQEESRFTVLEAQKRRDESALHEAEQSHEAAACGYRDEIAGLEARIGDIEPAINLAKSAAEAHERDPQWGVGPAIRFATVKDALAHHCQVHFLLDENGEAQELTIKGMGSAEVADHAKINVLPYNLHWLSAFHEYHDTPRSGPTYRGSDYRDSHDTTKAPCFYYIEETNEFLTTGNPESVTMPPEFSDQPRSGVAQDLSLIVGSFDEKVAAAAKELMAARSLAIEAPVACCDAHQLAIDEWKSQKAKAIHIAARDPAYTRLNQPEILAIIGPAWHAFVMSPWERKVGRTYALLKHICQRGALPHFYTHEHEGHFGFRLRTPDHNWIIGEIFCPSGTPQEALLLSPNQTVNHFGRGHWLSEIGPVKIKIDKDPSDS